MAFIVFPKGVPFIKRLFDCLLILPGLIIISPLLLVIVLIVRFHLGAPVFFRQRRPGYQNEIFTIFKFRTMQDLVDESGQLLPDEQRLTAFGSFMRAFSIDELPELFNVLRGEMSLVGPRPLLIDYLTLYTPEQARRHDILPGITGWAQIQGRNAITWEQKFEHDVWYVDHWSLWLDIKILLLTIWKVIIREGINQPGQATALPFTGNPDTENRDLI